MAALYTYLKGDTTVDLTEARNEIFTEYETMMSEAKAKMDIYEKARPVVLSILSDKPMTLKELFEEHEDLYPEGFSRGKLQYMMLNLMGDSIQIQKNGKNPNTYTLA